MMMTKFMGGALGTITLGGALLFHQGVVHVEVHEKRDKGANFHIILPATVISAAAMAVPDEKIARHAAQLEKVLPAARIAARELENCPDTVLVEVTSNREYVRVEKVGRSIKIDVESPREEVHVSVPLATIDSVLRSVQSAAARN